MRHFYLRTAVSVFLQGRRGICRGCRWALVKLPAIVCIIAHSRRADEFKIARKCYMCVTRACHGAPEERAQRLGAANHSFVSLASAKGGASRDWLASPSAVLRKAFIERM